VNNPKLVLADEPTAALDSKTGRDIVELMQRLAKEQGCTILMVTHDNRVLDIADRIIQMEDGHLSKRRVGAENETNGTKQGSKAERDCKLDGIN
jgi:putative ABC transport system ATP-binding protein